MESGEINTIKGLVNQLTGLRGEIELDPPVRVVFDNYNPDTTPATATISLSHVKH